MTYCVGILVLSVTVSTIGTAMLIVIKRLERRKRMRRNKVWLIAIIFGVMLITTVCYITSVKNARTTYVNGRVVENAIEKTAYPCISESGIEEKFGEII